MPAGRRRGQPHHRRRIPVVIGAGLVVVALAAVTLTVIAPRMDTTPAQMASRLTKAGDEATPKVTRKTRPVSADRRTATSRSRAADDKLAKQMAACRTAARAADEAITAAHRSAVEDWTAHIGAMQKLEAGKFTQEQTARVWKLTRTRGQERIDAFHKAAAAYRDRAGACLAIDPGAVSGDDRQTATACGALEDEANDALSAASATIEQWQGHINAMAARLAGKLDPATAQAKWMAAYHRAPTDIARYSRAERSYERARPKCPLLK